MAVSTVDTWKYSQWCHSHGVLTGSKWVFTKATKYFTRYSAYNYRFKWTALRCNIWNVTNHSMKPAPSWEAARSSALQEFPNILWNPKVHYRVHMSQLLIPILSNIYPTHTTPSYISKIHFNIIHPPTSWSS
jgi:hypothetical protein